MFPTHGMGNQEPESGVRFTRPVAGFERKSFVTIRLLTRANPVEIGKETHSIVCYFAVLPIENELSTPQIR